MSPLEYRHVTKSERRGRPPLGERALSGAERQARYRGRQAGTRPASLRQPRAIRPASRPQRWRAAVSELVASQAEYAAWFDALPDALRDSAIGERCRRLSVSTSTSLSLSSRRAASSAIEAAVRTWTAARPRGPTGTPRASLRRTRGGRCAMRGSPLWTPWTTRSARSETTQPENIDGHHPSDKKDT
jgi:hypothetical protein